MNAETTDSLREILQVRFQRRRGLNNLVGWGWSGAAHVVASLFVSEIRTACKNSSNDIEPSLPLLTTRMNISTYLWISSCFRTPDWTNVTSGVVESNPRHFRHRLCLQDKKEGLFHLHKMAVDSGRSTRKASPSNILSESITASENSLLQTATL